MTLPLTAAALAAGVGLGVWLSGPESGWAPPAATVALWAVAAVAITALSRRLGVPAMAGVLALAFVIGLWRGDVDRALLPAPASLAEAGEVTFRGELTDDPSPFGTAQRLTVRVDEVKGGGQAGFTVEVIAVRLGGQAPEDRSRFDFRVGDVYEITGEFEPGLTERVVGRVRFPSVVLVSSGRGDTVRGAISEFRSDVAESISDAMPEPEAGFAAAIAVGDRTGLDPDIRAAFRESGTAHLLAISGMHVAVIGVGTMTFAAWALGRRRQLYLLAPALAVWAYAVLAGFSDPTVRAAIMLTVYFAARALGRQRSGMPALGLAVIAMLLWAPDAISELSFQLSFAAVAGILLLTPPLIARIDTWFPGDHPWPRAVRAVLGVLALGLAATVATLPLVGHSFGVVPVWGIVATTVTLFALPFAIVLSGIAGLAGLLWGPLGTIAGVPAWMASAYIIETVEFFSDLPPGPVETAGWSIPYVLAYYGALIAVVVAARRDSRARVASRLGESRFIGLVRSGRAARPVPRWLILAASFGALATMVALTQLPGERLSVTFFETDRGDLILVETPGGRQMLVDGGEDPNGAVRAIGDVLPAWDRSLDVVVLTHPHADHVGGLLKVLEQYDVDYVLDAAVDYPSDTYAAWRSAVAAGEATHVVATAGQRIALDEDTFVDVLSAGSGSDSDANEGSVVLLLSHGDVSFLLTGDIGVATERRLLRERVNVDADVLKVAHQGSNGSSSNEFLTAISPAVSVIPVGADNPFGHPHPDAVARVLANTADGQVLTTAGNGRVRVSTDGARLWVETER